MRGIWLLVLVAGCGGGASADPPAQEDVESLCQSYNDRLKQCDRYGGASQIKCVQTFSCFREDSVRELVTCLEETACEAWPSNGYCQDVFVPLPIHDDVAWKCRHTLAACGKNEDEISYACGMERWVMFAAPIMDQLGRCFDEPCAAIAACTEYTEASCG